MVHMHTDQSSLKIKNPQKQLTTSKTFETMICKGVDRVRNFTVKSMTNPHKRFRIKKTMLAVRDVSKGYVKTTIHKHLAKIE